MEGSHLVGLRVEQIGPDAVKHRVTQFMAENVRAFSSIDYRPSYDLMSKI